MKIYMEDSYLWKKYTEINFCKTKWEYFGQICLLKQIFKKNFCPHAAPALPIKKSSGMAQMGIAH